MKITLCDICGKEIPAIKFIDTIDSLNFSVSSHGRTLDICDDCREDFNKWVAMRRAEKA